MIKINELPMDIYCVILKKMTSPVIWLYRDIIWEAGWWLLLSYDSMETLSG